MITNEQSNAIKEVLKDTSADSNSAVKAYHKIEAILAGSPVDVVLDRKFKSPVLKTEETKFEPSKIPTANPLLKK